MFALTVDADTELRLLQPEDAEPMYALIDANRAHLGRWFPWVADTTEVAHARDFIRRGLEKFGRADGFEAGIWHRGELCGALGLQHLDRDAGATELGYWLAERAQGRGVVTRAVRAAVDALFASVPRLERVVIRCWPDNLRSRAVPERLGFHHEGRLRHVARLGDGFVDHEVYSLLRGEWAAQPDPSDPRPRSRQESA